MANLRLRVVPNTPAVAVTSENKVIYVLVEVAADATARASLPMNLSLVIDTSGSMDGAKMNRVRSAARYVAGQLRPADTLSIVGFDMNATVYYSAESVTNLDRTSRVIDSIMAHGGTRISAGIASGLDQLKRCTQVDRTNRMILLTDGQTDRDEQECLRLAARAGDAQPSMTISTIGLGDDFNENLLLKIADGSRGHAYHLTDPEQIPEIFAAELSGAQAIQATSPLVRVKLASGVTLRRATRCRPEIVALPDVATHDRIAEIRLPDVEAEIPQAILLEVELPSRPANTYRVGQFSVDDGTDSVELELLMPYTTDVDQASRRTPEVMVLVDQVSIALLQQRALTVAEAGDVSRATQMLTNAHTRLLELGDTEQAANVTRVLSDLSARGQVSPTATKAIRFGTRALTLGNNT